MGQSLVKNYLHLTFSTKYREPLLYPPLCLELYAYLGGVCRELECPALAVGGFTDHVHILSLLSKKIALMTFVQNVKASSSKWIKLKDPNLEHFAWQDGYGAFSVNPAEVAVVIHYINNQEKHHSRKSFQDEYRAFLKKYNVPYDERYIWR